jgi:hypothetical protein
MTDRPSFWEQAFPGPPRRRDASFWRKVKKRLAQVEAPTNAQIRAAIAETEDFTQKAQMDRAADRALFAVQLRDEGRTFRQVGTALGCGPERARVIYYRGARILRRTRLLARS